jgi:signal transduction histidine kinase
LSTVNPVLTDRLDVIEELLLRTVDFPTVLDIRVIDPQGGSLSHVVRAPGRAPQVVFDKVGTTLALPGDELPQLQSDEAAERVHAWHPVVAGKLLGWVRLELSTAELGAMRARAVTGTLVAALLASLASVGLLSLLLREPLRAIERAKDFAVGLVTSEGEQMAVLDGPSETMALGQALNDASSRLLQQRRAIDFGIAELRRREAALADTNEQLSAIFELSPDGLVSFDAVGCIQFANPAFFRIMGLTAEALVGQPAGVLEDHLRAHCGEPGDYPGLAHFFPDPARPVSSHQPAETHDDGNRAVLTLTRPRRQVLALVGRHSQSASVSRLLYVRDVTRESEIDRMKSEFLSTAAHELRTPMTSIYGCADLLMSGEFDADKRRRLVGIVHRQTQVMMGLVDELLDLACIESRAGGDFNHQVVELGALIEQALHDFMPPEVRERPLWQRSAQPAWVRVDVAKTAQVLRNLLSNAYKYSREGPVDVRLLPAQGPQDALRVGFAVADRGIGMKPEHLARVCERFFRADSSGQVPGAGLGMSIVHEIISLMGGSLELASTPGEGTIVTVWLPCAASASALAQQQVQPDGAERGGADAAQGEATERQGVVAGAQHQGDGRDDQVAVV